MCLFCLILAVRASQMRAFSYYIMIGYIPKCKHIITNSTNVGRFAKAFGSIYLYKASVSVRACLCSIAATQNRHQIMQQRILK